MLRPCFGLHPKQQLSQAAVHRSVASRVMPDGLMGVMCIVFSFRLGDVRRVQ
ncbi:hypothetical protein ABG846_10625 [Phocaeicola vulgatus]